MAFKYNVCTCIAVIIINILCVYGFPKASSSESSDGNYTFPFYTRKDWGAVPPTDTRPMTTPIPYVIIHHTAVPGACHTFSQCRSAMKSMQNYHNSLHWGDIGYNFCVGSEGGAYEGRGWHVVGIHAGRANGVSVGICLIGDWRVESPPSAQLETTKALIAAGVEQGIISPDYKLIGHKQVKATECPGETLLDVISTWDHYVAGHVDFAATKKL